MNFKISAPSIGKVGFYFTKATGNEDLADASAPAVAYDPDQVLAENIPKDTFMEAPELAANFRYTSAGYYELSLLSDERDGKVANLEPLTVVQKKQSSITIPPF